MTEIVERDPDDQRYTENQPTLYVLQADAQRGQFTYKEMERLSDDELFYVAAHVPAFDLFDREAEALDRIGKHDDAESMRLQKNRLENNARRAGMLLQWRRMEALTTMQVNATREVGDTTARRSARTAMRVALVSVAATIFVAGLGWFRSSPDVVVRPRNIIQLPSSSATTTTTTTSPVGPSST